MIDINELRRLAQAAIAKMSASDPEFASSTPPLAILELLDRLEAAEEERDALRAKIEATERQEPLCWAQIDELDHAHELRRYARKIAHPAGDVPAVMLAAADEIERLQSVIQDRRLRDGVLADDDERGSRARGDA